MIKFSIIIPVYNEEGSLLSLYEQIKIVCDRIGKSHEFIFIDDGSKDKSFEIKEVVLN